MAIPWYNVRNMKKKGLPAITDKAVREKATNGPAGIRWDSVVEKVWKDIRKPRDDVRREVWEVQGRSRRRDRKKRKASAKKQGEIGETLEKTRGIKRRDRNENVVARPNGLHENAVTVFLCR